MNRRSAKTFIAVLIANLALATDAMPEAQPKFEGKIAPSVKDSVPHWPEPPKAPAGAPNIVVILLDDIGFADASTFGGVAQTPELDRLAARGLRYINFHVTGTCSPTRAALLSGRNHHRVGFGVAEGSAGYPGYNFHWKKSTVSMAEVLRRNGYSTAAIGKWHNTPYSEVTPLGPFDRWPTGLGFDYFYGFIAGMDSQWEPASLFRDTTPVEAPATPQQGYHFTSDIANEAIGWLRTQKSLSPERPYFLYFATGGPHLPHHAPKEWVDQYRGRFDRGWDQLRAEVFARQKKLGVIPANAALTPRPKEIPAWNSLSNNQRRLYARQMEVYAGFIAHIDHEIGRLLRAVQEAPGGDNTLILYVVGDNGSAGMGPDGHTDYMTAVEDQLRRVDELGSLQVAANDYAAGWGWLGNTPFQWWKVMASHFGGTRAPLLVSWPSRIKQSGAVRTQFSHVNDVAATLYEVTGIHFPRMVDGVEQQPLDGVSFAHTFDHADAPSNHHTQYFEMFGNRAIYRDGWVASALHWVPGFTPVSEQRDFERDRWELYHVAEDFSQARDLAARHPAKLKELQELFDTEARKNDVYPLGAAIGAGVPASARSQREFVYYSGTPRLQQEAMPPLAGTSYRITAEAVIPESGAQGVIISYGGRESGFALYLKGDRLMYENNYLNRTHDVIASDIPLPRGKVTLAFEFAQEGTSTRVGWSGAKSVGTGRLFINGRQVGQGKLTASLGAGYSETLGIGRAFGSPVSTAFQPPFPLTAALEKVTVQVQ